jgi:Ca2+-binding RTX toxin-like protein
MGGLIMTKIVGTNSNDDLVGTWRDDLIRGLDGADKLSGEGGSDRLEGGEGNDRVHGGAGNDYIWEDWDISGDDKLFGGDGSDNIFGGDGDDQLIGGRGEDYLDGGAGNDILDGGRFNDSYVPAWWQDWDVAGFNGADTGVSVNLRTGFAKDGQGGTDTLIDIEEIIGTQFDDRLVGGNAANNSWEGFEGGQGDDYINGGSGFDVAIYSFRGFNNERGIYADLAEGTVRDGMGGVDILQNIEAIWATDFSDKLKGSAGDDTFYTGDGYDEIVGRGGKDTVSYYYDRPLSDRPHGIDADLLRGTIFDMKYYTDFVQTVENVIGSRLDDDIRGTNYVNVLDGSHGDDLVKGRGGSDTLLGDFGNDHLDGGAGHDILDGGKGNDMLYGAGGSDTFVFGEDCDGDHIVYFKSGIDKIDVSAFGFDSTAEVLDALKILSPGAAMLKLGGDNYVIFDYVNTDHTVLAAGDIII